MPTATVGLNFSLERPPLGRQPQPLNQNLKQGGLATMGSVAAHTRTTAPNAEGRPPDKSSQLTSASFASVKPERVIDAMFDELVDNLGAALVPGGLYPGSATWVD